MSKKKSENNYFTYIALFRGINVGGRHILPMKELVGILKGLGCLHVQTYIQSGNVTFTTDTQDAARLSQKISKEVMKHKGFAPKVWLLNEQQWRKAVENNPFSTGVGKALHFFFMEEVPKQPDLDGLTSLKSTTESFVLKDSVFYLHAPDGIGRSKLVEKLGKFIQVPMTARNWNTVAKLSDMISQ